MKQIELRTTEKPGLSALSADAEAAGELKDVAALVMPTLSEKDPEQARDELSNALSQKHRRKLDIDEAVEIIVAAVVKQGRSSALEHIISRLPKDSCEFRWLTREEKFQRVVSRAADIIPQASELATTLIELVNAIKDQQRGGG